jgi:hypothetical protein
MHHPLHVLQAHNIGLVVWHLERYVHAPMGDHDDNNPQRIFVCFNSREAIELHETHGGSGATLGQEVGAGTTGYVAAPKLS